MTANDRTPLKTDPKYGYFPRWPEDGDDWIHPEDVDAARGDDPQWPGVSPRRHGGRLCGVALRQGAAARTARVVAGSGPEGLEIGDWVEVVSRGMVNERRTGTIREMLWDEDAQANALSDLGERPADRAALRARGFAARGTSHVAGGLGTYPDYLSPAVSALTA